MPKIDLALRKPLPTTAEGLRKRLAYLLEVRRSCDEEISSIRGTHINLTPATCHCLRCGYVWTPQKFITVHPKVCARCKSTYWNRPRIHPPRSSKYRKVSDDKATYKQLIEEAKPVAEAIHNAYINALAPPPAAPMSLRERLKAMQQEEICAGCGAPESRHVVGGMETWPYCKEFVKKKQQPTAETEPNESSSARTPADSAPVSTAVDESAEQQTEQPEEVKESLGDA